MNSLILAGGSTTSSIVMIIVFVCMLIGILVFPSIGNKKRLQAYKEMQDGLKAGDLVQLTSGIIGRIVRVSEIVGIKTIILETGVKGNKTLIEVNIDAIAGVMPRESEISADSVVETKIETIEPEEITKEVLGEDASETTHDEIDTLIAETLDDKPANAKKKSKSKNNKK